MPAPLAPVDFHILADGINPVGYACRLVEGFYLSRQTVHVHTADEAQARALDDALWSFRAGSFVPHHLSGSHGEAPVWIGWPGAAPAAPAEVLVNLGADVDGAGYSRIAELVPADPAGRAAARSRYRQYRERGHELLEHRPADGPTPAPAED